METPSAYGLCDLADVKADLDIAETDTTFDDKLRRIIAAVTAAAETFCGRPFLARNVKARKYDGDGTVELLLLTAPVLSVSALVVDSATIASSGYVLYSDIGRVVRTDGGLFSEGYQNVSVSMRVGWESQDVPADVELAARLWTITVFKWMKEQRYGVDSHTSAEESVSYTPRKIPDEVRELLEPWKLWR